MHLQRSQCGSARASHFILTTTGMQGMPAEAKRLGQTSEAADGCRHHGRGLLMARDDEPYPPALAQAVHKVQVLLACRSAWRASAAASALLLANRTSAPRRQGLARVSPVQRRATSCGPCRRPHHEPPAASGAGRTRHTKDVVHVLVLQRPARPAQACAPAALASAGLAAERGRRIAVAGYKSPGESVRTV